MSYSETTYMLKFIHSSTHYFTWKKVFKPYIHHFFSFFIVTELNFTGLAREIYSFIGVVSFAKFLVDLQMGKAKE